MISAQNVSKSFGAVTAVRDFNCRIEPATIVGLIGSNGAGKTTLLRMLSGYLPPTTGEVWLNGHSLFHSPELARQQIGYLPESVPLYGDMRVRDYLAYVASLKNVKPGLVSWRVSQVIEQCALGAVAGQKIARLSRGYRQRTGLAQAIVSDPPILLCDEPTSALDPAQIGHTRNLFRELARNKAILVSTHVLGEVEQLCQEIIVLRQGEVVLAGKLTELLQQNWLVVQSEAPLAELGQRVGQIAGVVATEITPRQELRVQFANGHDPRHSIGHLCRDAGWALSRLELAATSLEHLYLSAAKAGKWNDDA